MRITKRILITLVLAMTWGMVWIFGQTAGVPFDALRRAQRRQAVRGLHQVRMPRPASKVYLWMRRQSLHARRYVKYNAIEAGAAALAIYCWATRQPGFEGVRMSYWRWMATIHLALKERAQKQTALDLGYSWMQGSGGGLTYRNGEWRPVPSGGAKTHVGQVSPLYYKKVAGGLPVLMDMTVFPGNIFFVDSGETTDGADTAGYGTHPDKPFLTIDFSIAQCTASQADVIFALPGHNDSLAAAATIDLDVAGISVIGVGRGADRPRIDYDAADASIDIGASSCMIKNAQLLPSVTIVTIGIDNETLFTDAVLEDIEVLAGEDGAGVDEFVTGIELKVTCTRATIIGFEYDTHASTTNAARAIYFNGASTRVRVEDFWIDIVGTDAVAGIEGTGSSLRSLIKNGTITTDAEPGIELAAGQTGVIEDVDIFADLATIAAATVAAGMAHFRVRYVEVGNESDAAVKTASVDD